MPQVLIVSKPVAPPWNDSSKNLARDVRAGLSRYAPLTLSRVGDSPDGHASLGVYPPSGTPFALGLGDHVALLASLLARSTPDIWHFFFAPNTKSSTAAWGLSRLRGKRTVQTVCSAPAQASLRRSLFFAQRTVVLSAKTERLLSRFVPANKLIRIPPCVPELVRPDIPARLAARVRLGVGKMDPLVVYAGDLEFGGGAERTLEACASMEVELIMACRAKTPAALGVERDLRARYSRRYGERLRWVGEVGDILGLLATADTVVLPSTDLYAKMDYPLVLLESLALGTPVVVAAGSAAAELAGEGVHIAEESGLEKAIGDALDGCDPVAMQARMRADYSVAGMARAYEAVYDSLPS